MKSLLILCFTLLTLTGFTQLINKKNEDINSSKLWGKGVPVESLNIEKKILHTPLHQGNDFIYNDLDKRIISNYKTFIFSKGEKMAKPVIL